MSPAPLWFKQEEVVMHLDGETVALVLLLELAIFLALVAWESAMINLWERRVSSENIDTVHSSKLLIVRLIPGIGVNRRLLHAFTVLRGKTLYDREVLRGGVSTSNHYWDDLKQDPISVLNAILGMSSGTEWEEDVTRAAVVLLNAGQLFQIRYKEVAGAWDSALALSSVEEIKIEVRGMLEKTSESRLVLAAEELFAHSASETYPT